MSTTSEHTAAPLLTRGCRRSVSFLDTCQLVGLQQHVHQPTRGANTLDLVLSTTGMRISTSVQEGLISSDHQEVRCDISASYPSTPIATRSTVLNYKRADWDGLRNALRLIPWNTLLDDPCIDNSVDNFYGLLEAAIRDHIPTVTLKRKHPPWFDRDLRATLALKETAYRRKKRNPCRETCEDFRDKRRDFKNLSCGKFHEYVRNLVGDFKANPKRFWSFVKCMKQGAKGLSVLVNGSRTVVDDVEPWALELC